MFTGLGFGGADYDRRNDYILVPFVVSTSIEGLDHKTTAHELFLTLSKYIQHDSIALRVHPRRIVALRALPARLEAAFEETGEIRNDKRIVSAHPHGEPCTERPASKPRIR